MERTGVSVVNDSAWSVIWTVPAGHKYELLEGLMALDPTKDPQVLLLLVPATGSAFYLEITEPLLGAVQLYRYSTDSFPFQAGDALWATVIGHAGSAAAFAASYVDVDYSQ